MSETTPYRDHLRAVAAEAASEAASTGPLQTGIRQGARRSNWVVEMLETVFDEVERNPPQAKPSYAELRDQVLLKMRGSLDSKEIQAICDGESGYSGFVEIAIVTLNVACELCRAAGPDRLDRLLAAVADLPLHDSLLFRSTGEIAIAKVLGYAVRANLDPVDLLHQLEQYCCISPADVQQAIEMKDSSVLERLLRQWQREKGK